ncbi:MAG TPA: DUF6600 domain-containing protein [Burkholderiales bacterium]|nr:DUF6600 domain-containing protein [Burkholderiales bacterium]
MKLLRMFAAAALAFAVALASAAESDPPRVVGRLNYISGPVSFAPAQANEDWVAATLNRPLTTGDRLWTDSNGTAELHVGSLAIRMAAQTSLDVLNLDERTLQLRLAQGNVNLRVRRLSSDKRLEIATPGGAVVVKRPGSYRIGVDPSGAATTVVVRAGGQADVFTANSTFAVGDGQQATISGSREDLYAAPPPDEFDRWAASRDQREGHVASTRYVPDEMTGYEDLDQYGAWQTVPDYGAIWVPTTVPAGWAPYRYGHWVWVAPWGWTWVDDAPWGFAPFHYGRWVWLHDHWAWAPGRRIAQPVYSPAMVAFIGGAGFSVSVGISRASAVGWVPLGWREPYIPWYRASRAHVQSVNVTNVTNVTNISNVTNIRYINRSAPSAVTVVSRENFMAARPVRQAALDVPARTLAAASVMRGSPVATPARASLAAAQAGSRPPAAITTREAVAVNTPPAPARVAARDGRENGRGRFAAGDNERPRVRVINQQERVNLPVSDMQRAVSPAQLSTEAQRAGVQHPTAPEAQRPPAQAERGNTRSAEDAAPQSGSRRSQEPPGTGGRGPESASPQAQAARRAPGPPPETSRRPTFDRDMRASTAVPAAPSATDSTRELRQAERQQRREHAAGQTNAGPQTQAQVRPAPRASAPDAQRAQQQEQQRQRQQEEQQRAQQLRAQQQEQQRQRQVQEQQARRQQEGQQRAQQEQQRQQLAQQQRAQQEQRHQQQVQQQRAEQEQRQHLAQQQRAQQEQQRNPQAQQPRRAEQSREKGGRERPRPEKSEKE